MTSPAIFAGSFLAQRGALVEHGERMVEAVLPPALVESLGLPEHVVLSEEEARGVRRIGYGSELLDRLLGQATAHVPVGAAQLVGPPAREAPAREAAARFVVRNGVFAVGPARPLAARRLWLHCAYAIDAEERREGLVSAVVSLESGTPVEGFEDAALGQIQSGPAEPSPPAIAEQAVRVAHEACQRRAWAATATFRAAMERRHERDRERIEGYFADLEFELDRRAVRERIDRAAAEEKRAGLRRDREAKLEALAARHLARIALRPAAALVVRSPAFLVAVEIRRRKAARTVELEFDCATRRLVPGPCEGCRAPAARPAACDDALHLLCETCAPRSLGRVACPACGRAPAGDDMVSRDRRSRS